MGSSLLAKTLPTTHFILVKNRRHWEDAVDHSIFIQRLGLYQATPGHFDSGLDVRGTWSLDRIHGSSYTLYE